MSASSLAEYRRKRRFDKTREPKPGKPPKPPVAVDRSIFVVQLHHASSRHYDFRLQVGGTLKSWAVPKGPSFDPKVKRLAAQVEDHPVDYADFEGDIPEGQYGAGHVAIFDRGVWSTADDPQEQLARGHLRFELFGDRLKGGWHLVRNGGGSRKPQWLLFKRRDEYAAQVEADDLLDSVAPPADGNDTMRLTHPERVVYRDRGTTKGDVADYYVSVMSWLLPEILNRPLSIIRCPQGTEKACFFQRHHTAGLRLIDAVPVVEESGATANYLVVRNAESLMELVQFNSIEFHPWGSTAEQPDRADRLVFDLDPGPGVPWPGIVAAARQIRELLQGVSLQSFARTSGGKGLHVVVPLNPGCDWSVVKPFARAVATSLAAQHPSRYVAVATKSLRSGRIFIDYLRNGHSATSIASYSLRARAGAPVAAPVSWEELDKLKCAHALDIESMPARLARLRADPWEGIDDMVQDLDAAGALLARS